jgi:ABC-type transport system involved in cytochrome bd biosynthesis fused ATPase/permease subunit
MVKEAGPDVNHGQVIRYALMSYLKCDILHVILGGITQELIAIFYTFFISYMIRYVKQTKRDIKEGLIIFAIFFVSQGIGAIVRQRALDNAFKTSNEVKKLLTSLIYNKIEKLSVKSITETNSGKLISLISSDLF